jgi:hypothetical protein
MDKGFLTDLYTQIEYRPILPKDYTYIYEPLHRFISTFEVYEEHKGRFKYSLRHDSSFSFKQYQAFVNKIKKDGDEIYCMWGHRFLDEDDKYWGILNEVNVDAVPERYKKYIEHFIFYQPISKKLKSSTRQHFGDIADEL